MKKRYPEKRLCDVKKGALIRTKIKGGYDYVIVGSKRYIAVVGYYHDMFTECYRYGEGKYTLLISSMRLVEVVRDDNEYCKVNIEQIEGGKQNA